MTLRDGMEEICTLSPISPQGFFPSLHTHRSSWAKRPLQPTRPCQSFRSSRWVTQALWSPRIPHPSAPRAARARGSRPPLPLTCGTRGQPKEPRKRGRPAQGLHPLRGGHSPFLRHRNPVWERGMSCPHTAG